MRVLLIGTLLLLGALVALGVVVSWNRAPAEPEDPDRVTIDLPEGHFYGGASWGRLLDISPDGKRVVYIGRVPGKSARLYMHEIGTFKPREIAGTHDAHDPTFSPDGRFVAFYAGESLKKADIAENTVSVIGPVPDVRGLAWLGDDTFILGNVNGGLLRLDASQPDPVPLFDFMGPQLAHLHPEILPGRKAVLFTIATGSVVYARIWMADLKTGEERPLLEENAFAPRYVPTGHIVFARGIRRELAAMQFDLEKMKVAGSPQSVLQRPLSGRGSGGSTDFSISGTGTLVYTPRRDGSIDDVLAELADVSLTQIHVQLNWLEELKGLVQ